MKTLQQSFLRLKEIFFSLEGINERFDEIKLNQGAILTAINSQKKDCPLSAYEFKVFSQWGEDGILQFLIKAIPIKNKTFIEFGVETFNESNCRFLMMKDNWKGFVIDGSKSNIKKLKRSYFFWKYHLNAIYAFITKENINSLLEKSGFPQDLGILSIDLDGNDYYILEAITYYQPRILICEFNSIFGKDRKISVPYKPNFHRTKEHYSNLFFGASLAAITDLADKKGYCFIGTNSNSNNAFFIRKELMNQNIYQRSIDEAFEYSNFRESRNEQGGLTYLSEESRLTLLKGMSVFNVETNQEEYL
jgi:hypothetical protein